MKKSIILVSMAISSLNLFAQNTPVVEKAAPKSNNALPSNGTLGSNSGVNPAGNPGTILSYSGNSNSVNTKLSPSPNIEPGTFLTSSPEGTVTTIPGVSNPNMQKASTVTQYGGTVTAAVVTPAKKAPVTEPVIANAPVEVNKPIPVPPAEPKKVVITAKDNRKETVSLSPVLSNYVPQEVINKINAKYGATVYDIKTVRIVSSNKIAYLVRLVEDGKYRNELYYAE